MSQVRFVVWLLLFALICTGARAQSDTTAPRVLGIGPAPGQVTALNSINVVFSEAVQGVSANDLLINNVPASGVSGSGANYTFTFPQPSYGIVDVTWEAANGITDLASPPNDFVEANWQYQLNDGLPPMVVSVNPPDGSTVRSLSQIEIRFSETVAGVNASDLLVNGVPATSVTTNRTLYTFQFPAPANGPVTITWAANHSIKDTATPGNAFTPQNYSYTVDSNYVAADVIIGEFLSAEENPAGLADEDGELQDWIELFNGTTKAVNLAGWSLTDDPEDPDLWLFPNVTIASGGRLVVFASAKDRRPTSGNLHTNFKLNNAGEYLALFNNESPRRATTEVNYPEQRNDYSYGIGADKAWHYFVTPTPGQTNTSATVAGVIPKLKPSVKRGTFDAPFTLAITNEVAGVTIRYTTDGSQPTASSGSVYSAPLTISKTTVLRAAAFRTDYLPSETLTESYIFLDQVLQQPNNPPGFPVGATVEGGYPSDYEMDPEIVNDPAYASQMKAAMQALPIISIAIKMDDMFGSVNGIYTHPLNRGPSWERPCSIEFMAQDGKGFQSDAGLQIQGNAARDPQKQPKHPMRVVFKGDYGPSKLDFQMFPDSPLTSFDTLVLRADFNNSWLHWDTTQRKRGQRTRDAWMKDSMRAMGNLASHNRYTHLFINGLYWGIYDPTERPDAAFAAEYLGGSKADWDVVNEGAAVDGDMTAYNAMLGITNLGSATQYDLMRTYLDMPQFIDYMLLHFYVGHEDWGFNKNWYTMRPRDGSAGFKYVPWDGENILGDATINRVSNTDVPSGLHTKLLSSAEYKLAFADRVQKHFFNNGALTPAAASDRWMNRARELEQAILGESARWGDYRRDVHQFQNAPYELYTRNNQWRTEQTRLTNSYFPGRTATVLSQLKTAGLYPSVNAPAFNQNGGHIDPNFKVTMTGTATIYYTTNGVDPRVYGTSAISSDAKAYTSSGVTLTGSAMVKARSLNGGIWSALTEAAFSTESARIPLRFTEIMYNADPPGDAYEFLELQNFSTLPMDVSGFYITGVDYIFPPRTVLAPGQIVLLASSQNSTSFKARYPGTTPFGYFGGQLLNRGERVAIVRPDGRTVTSVPYDDEAGWAPEADGGGRSLEIINPLGDASDPANWRASSALNGSPGAANPARPNPIVVINEIFASSTDNTEFIELQSQAASAIDLSGWTLWKVGNSNRFTFPGGTSLGAGALLVLHCDKQTNATGLHSSFALDSDGDTYVLAAANGVRIDATSVGGQAQGFSSGLFSGAWKLCAPTPGAANSAANVGAASSLVINEWMANSAPGEEDWLEVYNTNPTLPIDLRGLYFGVTNQLFEITRPTFVSAGGYLRLFADEAGHLDFKLPAEGATMAIYDASSNVIHRVTYAAQTEGVSQGRYPDGSSTIIDFPFATPGAMNTLSFPITLASDGATLQLTWPAQPNAAYQIQTTADLKLAWSRFADVTAPSSTATFGIPIGAGNSYFRIARLP